MPKCTLRCSDLDAVFVVVLLKKLARQLSSRENRNLECKTSIGNSKGHSVVMNGSPLGFAARVDENPVSRLMGREVAGNKRNPRPACRSMVMTEGSSEERFDGIS
jgi:hypothetical protein